PLLRAAAWFCGPSVPVGSVVVCGGADCPLFHRPPYRGTGDGGDSRLDRSWGGGRGRLGTVGTVVVVRSSSCVGRVRRTLGCRLAAPVPSAGSTGRGWPHTGARRRSRCTAGCRR